MCRSVARRQVTLTTRCVVAFVLIGSEFPLKAAAYYTKLRRIRTSEGAWDRPFDPDITSYEVRLSPQAASVIIESGVDFGRYGGPNEYPVVATNGDRASYGEGEPVSSTLRFDPSLYRQEQNVQVVVSAPSGWSGNTTIYSLRLIRPPDLDRLLRLRRFELQDARGPLTLRPAFDASQPLPSTPYGVLVDPDVLQVRVSAECDSLAGLEVDGSPTDNGTPLWVSINAHAPHTLVRIACTYGADRRSASVDFRERVDLQHVPVTLAILGDRGVVERSGESSFDVAATANNVQIIALYSDMRVALELMQADGSALPLGSGIPSPPLRVPETGNRSVALRLRSSTVASGGDAFWSLAVVLRRYVAPIPAVELVHSVSVASAGYVVVVLVTSVAAGLLVLMSAAAFSGFGTPCGASAALRSLALLLQFSALSNVVQGPCALTDFTHVLQRLALFPTFRGFVPSGSALRVGVPEAIVCLGASIAILCTVAALHILLLARQILKGRRHTLPYVLRFGSWEARCLMLLAYPMSCAAALLLLQAQDDDLDPNAAQWRAVAAATLTIPSLVALCAAISVRNALRDRLVTWVHQGPIASASADAQRDHDGYFCDVTCDQLCSRPLERSFCGSLMSQSWAVVLADIVAVDIEDTIAVDSVMSPEMKHLLLPEHSDGEDWEPQVAPAQAAKPVHVEVVATLPAASLFQPFFSDVGYCTSSSWLEAHLDARSLLRLHQEVDDKLHDGATPLRVRVSQLRGRVTSGWLSWCFDGLRWPLLPSLELGFRVVLGVLSALTIAWPGARPLTLGASGLLSGALFAVVFFEMPCTSFVESMMLLLAYVAMAVLALTFWAYSVGVFSMQTCSFLGLVSLAGAVALLLSYVLVLFVSLFCAATCPIGHREESDKLRRCNVDLGLRGPKDSWLLLLQAYCRVPVTDAFVHAMPTDLDSVDVFVAEKTAEGVRPRLEFPVLDYLATGGALEPPLAIIFGPGRHEWGSVAYLSEAVYGDEDPHSIVDAFVRSQGDPVITDCAPQIVREVAALIQRRARPQSILVVDLVIGPKRPSNNQRLDDNNQSGSDSEQEMLLWSSVDAREAEPP